MSCVGRGIVLRQMGRLFGEGTLTGLGDGQLLERYLTRRDEGAFEALVDMHGPMVLGLCRRMLRDPRDIEDAFQATFLVLVQKAPGIRDRSLLSNWLYGVAVRVARRARSRTLRRRDRETAVGEPEAVVEADPDSAVRSECDAVLDQELRRLPDKYRAPLVLCYLRGRTHDQAAEELRCPVGTVRSRLARGRALLRDRLTRRGVAPTATAVLLGSDATLPARLLVATVPPPLAATTVRAALEFGSSFTMTAGASSLALAHGVLTTMKMTQFKWVGLAALAATLSAGGVVAVSFASSTAQDPAPRRPAAEAVREDGAQRPPESRPVKTLEEERLKALEDKIDRLSGQLLGEGALIQGNRNPRAQAGGTTSALNSRNADAAAVDQYRVPRPSDPIEELDARLKLSVKEYGYAKKLAERQAISSQEVDQYLLKAQSVAGKVVALDHDFQDEMERLMLERSRKGALAEKAVAQREVAESVTARNRRLNERKPGVVGPEEVTRAEAELKVAEADVAITRVDVDDVALRIRQLARRRARLRDAIAIAEQIIKESASQP